MAHLCHARRCGAACPPEHLMCVGHWRLVPPSLRAAVWGTYREGQCQGRPRPSRAWHDAADAAIDAVEIRERGIHDQRLWGELARMTAARLERRVRAMVETIERRQTCTTR